jgi:hypothetical protein
VPPAGFVSGVLEMQVLCFRARSLAKMTGSDLRRYALALPHVRELEHMGAPAFRVDGKIFAQLSADENVTLLKLELAEQQALLLARGEHVWPADHWGKFGWTHLRVESFGDDDLRVLVERSWSLIAPKRLAAQWALGIELE